MELFAAVVPNGLSLSTDIDTLMTDVGSTNKKVTLSQPILSFNPRSFKNHH